MIDPLKTLLSKLSENGLREPTVVITGATFVGVRGVTKSAEWQHPDGSMAARLNDHNGYVRITTKYIDRLYSYPYYPETLAEALGDHIRAALNQEPIHKEPKSTFVPVKDATALAVKVKEDPHLQVIVDAWPSLPQETRDLLSEIANTATEKAKAMRFGNLVSEVRLELERAAIDSTSDPLDAMLRSMYKLGVPVPSQMERCSDARETRKGDIVSAMWQVTDDRCYSTRFASIQHMSDTRFQLITGNGNIFGGNYASEADVTEAASRIVAAMQAANSKTEKWTTQWGEGKTMTVDEEPSGTLMHTCVQLPDLINELKLKPGNIILVGGKPYTAAPDDKAFYEAQGPIKDALIKEVDYLAEAAKIVKRYTSD